MSTPNTIVIFEVPNVQVFETLSSLIIGHSKDIQLDLTTIERNPSPVITAKSISKASFFKLLVMEPRRVHTFHVEGEDVPQKAVFDKVKAILRMYLT